MRFTDLPTPCFIIDENRLVQNLAVLRDVARRSGAKILLAQKAFSMFSTYPLLREYLAGSAAKLTPDDEFYLFSVGYISAGRKRISLATAGGRISGEELTGLLDALRARQYLFLFNTHGAALFEPLAKGTRFVVSATDDPAQSNPPALPRFFLAEWR